VRSHWGSRRVIGSLSGQLCICLHGFNGDGSLLMSARKPSRLEGAGPSLLTFLYELPREPRHAQALSRDSIRLDFHVRRVSHKRGHCALTFPPWARFSKSSINCQTPGLGAGLRQQNQLSALASSRNRRADSSPATSRARAGVKSTSRQRYTALLCSPTLHGGCNCGLRT
jgi:hypothetical protein